MHKAISALILGTLLVSTTSVFAQKASDPAPAENPPNAPQKQQIEMLLLPSVLVHNLMNTINAITILHPELETPIIEQMFGVLNACISDNPVNGIVRRMGPDQCQAVTDALTKEETDMQTAIKSAVAVQKAEDEKSKTLPMVEIGGDAPKKEAPKTPPVPHAAGAAATKTP